MIFFAFVLAFYTMVVWRLVLGMDRIAAMNFLSKLKKTQGFTLVELILVMIIISALAVYAYPRFSGKSGYSEFTLQARLISALRHMQTRAMQDTRADFCYQINLINQVAGGNIIFPTFGPPKLEYIDDGEGAFLPSNTCSLDIEFNHPELNPENLRTSFNEMNEEGVSMEAKARNETEGSDVNVNFVKFTHLGRPIVDSDPASDPVISCINTCKITFTGTSGDKASICIESQGYIHACP